MNQNEYEPRERSSGSTGRHSKAPAKKKSRAGKTILIVITAVIVVVLLAGFLVFRSLFNKMGTGSHADTQGTAAATTESSDYETAPTAEPTPTPTPRPLTEEEIAKQEELALMASLQEDAEEILSSDDVYNILLLGSDGRTVEVERSDAMILLSINERTKTIWLTSFMRDTEVWIADWGTGHLNWATNYGGVEMLINTLESEQNFAIRIDNWAMVDFVDFIDVADLLGPVNVSVTWQEAEDINLSVREACQVYDEANGLTDTENTYPRSYFSIYGDYDYTVTNGAQILGYCRERHLSGDRGRSEKQRDVLTQFWGNIQKMSLKEQYTLAEKIMSIVKTDITMGKCAALLLKAPQYVTYEIKTQQCPVEGAFWRGMDANSLSIYNADFAVNRNFLRATIYGEEVSEADLTSYWTGAPVVVYTPEE